ncbi:MAG: TldD/PmbA family protein [Pseudanabaena sp.]|jgi:PmbA protein|nr:TldD/PmbA family protein [Pseudanabaena sp. M090S1SP2A07QC]MCA6507877.1 TldD/PmbA family protein [Pseudanabaena sp. M172S2SP2A07QC]MCA6509356.1 TldD/PmbA family protein [Pseudanabaena sp. M109S1SP2A07QC]MCA6518988.1 TldD/PmbA family protein [Pseudanabaena sp. M110S1SP2A07QC]MCA6524210.1 TldD/PmbA family protein [Pseudanabaena sp. M051S1SP2A07QC]MCA6527378.1 TldD/PmbA family protein [Pseudanabaena sp. M179S2SP2A07QC]MCA6531984.1 TldD/PmbA family protein [Pseudanabaena sp. M125S2SP2A07QC]MC
MSSALSVEQLVSDAKETANKLKINKFDIYGAIVDETSAEVDSGAPKQVSASNRASITVRVWNDHGTVGVTSTTNIDRIGLELALQSAHEASFFGAKENIPDFSPEAIADIPPRESQTSPQTAIEQLVETLLVAEKELLAKHTAIAGVPYNGLSQRDVSRFYLNSDGAMRNESSSLSSIYLYTKTEEEGRKPRSGGAYRVSRSFENLDVKGCVEETAEKTISHLNYDKIKSGKYLVVFSPEAFLSLVSAFSSLFNAQSILDKNSLSNPESIGTQIASPLLNVSDDELHIGNVGASTFDGEGTPTRRTPLITNGMLTNFLHSSVTAKRLNAKPTGNGSVGAKVYVSPNFFHIERGSEANASNQTVYDLATAENVILIDDLQALHAGVQASQGSFSLPFDGWLVNKGDRISVESATVAGDILELLKAIVYVEPEVKITPSGVAPQIWVEGLSITGEA